MNQDEDQLNLLRIFHLVYALLCFVFALFPVIYIVFGAAFLAVPESLSSGEGNNPPHQLMGGAFLAFGIVFMLVIVGYGVLQLLVARGIAAHKWWPLGLVVSALNCMNVPFGTVLGVFTFVVFLKPSVKTLFGQP